MRELAASLDDTLFSSLTSFTTDHTGNSLVSTSIPGLNSLWSSESSSGRDITVWLDRNDENTLRPEHSSVKSQYGHRHLSSSKTRQRHVQDPATPTGQDRRLGVRFSARSKPVAAHRSDRSVRSDGARRHQCQERIVLTSYTVRALASADAEAQSHNPHCESQCFQRLTRPHCGSRRYRNDKNTFNRPVPRSGNVQSYKANHKPGDFQKVLDQRDVQYTRHMKNKRAGQGSAHKDTNNHQKLYQQNVAVQRQQTPDSVDGNTFQNFNINTLNAPFNELHMKRYLNDTGRRTAKQYKQKVRNMFVKKSTKPIERMKQSDTRDFDRNSDPREQQKKPHKKNIILYADKSVNVNMNNDRYTGEDQAVFVTNRKPKKSVGIGYSQSNLKPPGLSNSQKENIENNVAEFPQNQHENNKTDKKKNGSKNSVKSGNSTSSFFSWFSRSKPDKSEEVTNAPSIKVTFNEAENTRRDLKASSSPIDSNGNVHNHDITTGAHDDIVPTSKYRIGDRAETKPIEAETSIKQKRQHGEVSVSPATTTTPKGINNELYQQDIEQKPNKLSTTSQDGSTKLTEVKNGHSNRDKTTERLPHSRVDQEQNTKTEDKKVHLRDRFRDISTKRKPNETNHSAAKDGPDLKRIHLSSQGGDLKLQDDIISHQNNPVEESVTFEKNDPTLSRHRSTENIQQQGSKNSRNAEVQDELDAKQMHTKSRKPTLQTSNSRKGNVYDKLEKVNRAGPMRYVRENKADISTTQDHETASKYMATTNAQGKVQPQLSLDVETSQHRSKRLRREYSLGKMLTKQRYDTIRDYSPYLTRGYDTSASDAENRRNDTVRVRSVHEKDKRRNVTPAVECDFNRPATGFQSQKKNFFTTRNSSTGKQENYIDQVGANSDFLKSGEKKKRMSIFGAWKFITNSTKSKQKSASRAKDIDETIDSHNIVKQNGQTSFTTTNQGEPDHRKTGDEPNASNTTETDKNHLDANSLNMTSTAANLSRSVTEKPTITTSTDPNTVKQPAVARTTATPPKTICALSFSAGRNNTKRRDLTIFRITAHRP